MAVDDAVDKEKFTAAIFRRGNKQELFSGAGDSDTAGTGHGSDHAPTGDEKLDELLKLWSLPRSGRDLSAAIWRPEKCAAEVVLKKGKLFSHVGSVWGSKLYLTIEEAAFMVDRGSMLLFYEQGIQKKKMLLSMKECYALMESCGVPIDNFIMYCKLMRAGFIAHRSNIPWVLKNREDISRLNFEYSVGNVDSDATSSGHKRKRHDMSSFAAGLQRGVKSSTRGTGSAKSREWWPVYQYHDETACSNLPTCIVDNEETRERTRLQAFPRMAPLQHDTEALESPGLFSDITYMDVYPPNAGFSRKNMGEKSGYVSMVACGRDHPPPLHTMTCVQHVDAPVRFVGIEHGDIAFYSFLKTKLRDIHT